MIHKFLFSLRSGWVAKVRREAWIVQSCIVKSKRKGQVWGALNQRREYEAKLTTLKYAFIFRISWVLKIKIVQWPATNIKYKFGYTCGSSFIHPLAAVTNSLSWKNVYRAQRGPFRRFPEKIIIEDGCNVQENCTATYVSRCYSYFKENAHIGHGAVIRRLPLEKNCLVGMNAVIMDNVNLGDNCIVGALSFIKLMKKFLRKVFWLVTLQKNYKTNWVMRKC